MPQVVLDEDGRRVGPRGRIPIGDVIAVRLPREIRAEIDSAAAELGMTRAALLRRIVALALDERWLAEPGAGE